MICGLICKQNEWRMRTKRAISEVFVQETITKNVITAGRLRWAVHITRMDNKK